MWWCRLLLRCNCPEWTDKVSISTEKRSRVNYKETQFFLLFTQCFIYNKRQLSLCVLSMWLVKNSCPKTYQACYTRSISKNWVGRDLGTIVLNASLIIETFHRVFFTRGPRFVGKDIVVLMCTQVSLYFRGKIWKLIFHPPIFFHSTLLTHSSRFII